MTLSPKSGLIVLLPEDWELIKTLGITEAQYRFFVREALKHSRIEPGKPQALLLVPFIANLVIGLALSYVSSLLAPKNTGGGPTIRQTQKQGQNVAGQTEFAPKAGFDSIQNVVELGSTIPVIYSKRETIDGVIYGGVRVNTNLIWSQMQSFGGNQLLRAIFLIGEAPVGTLDPTQFAFGDNTISGYDLGLGNQNNSRVTFYAALNGGRIVSGHRIAGRSANKDPGNAENDGAPDVFQVRGLNNAWTSDFCYAYKPATQTQFGVYSLIGVGLGYRVNPNMRPAVTVKTQPEGDKGKVKLQCDPDGVAKAQRDKYNFKFPTYSGVTQINGINYNSSGQRTLNVGDTVTYFIDRKSDAKKIFRGAQPGDDHKETCNDVAQTVAGRQKNYDDSCNIGDLYKLGTAHLVCEERSPSDEIFLSQVDQDPIGGGQSMTITFRVVKSGVAVIRSPSQSTTATSSSHLLKLAICAFSLSRPAQVIELGFKSSIGIRISGLCNFRDAISHKVIDGRACEYYKGRVYGKGQSLGLSNYSSGSFSGSERRYSFFRIGYRVAGSDAAYTYMAECFGFAGVTQQNQFNYIRLQMPSYETWEYKLEPISGWEIRNNYATGSLEILDAKINTTRTVSSSGVTATFSGKSISRTRNSFQMAATRDRKLGINTQDSRDYADDWGKLAEAFVYEEIQSSARAPEHELTYINIITPNLTVPNYDSMSILGMNVRSSTEFSQLKQLSVYISSGLNNTHSFPEILLDLLLMPRYGMGTSLSTEQVNNNLFYQASTWTLNRRYFWDGTLPEPVNIRQWASTTASYFLLDFIIRNGKFALQPAVYFDQPELITNLYTNGNILEDSFEISYADVEQRTPKRISIKWRHERPSNTDNSPGIFPLIREINVREAGTPEDAPLESIDLSDFCTSQQHAIDIAKYLCRTSRLVTHSVSFKTIPTKAGLEIGRCFKLGLETVNYLQPNNGVIDGTGWITSTTPLANGTYTVLLWDGITTNIQEVSLTVTNGFTTQYANVVFCIKEAVVSTQAYKVQSLSFDEDGNLQVEASVFPLMQNGYSMITDGWDVASNWIIEGQIGTSQTTGSAIASFNNVSIVGSSSLTVNVSEEYVALISGTAGSYYYQWSGSGFTFSNPNGAETAITATTTGDLTLYITITGNGNTITKSVIIEVLNAETELELIGTATISGPTVLLPNIPYSYTCSYTSKPAPIGAGSIQPDQSYQIVNPGTTDFTTIGALDNSIGTVFIATAPGTGSGTVDDVSTVFMSWEWSSPSPNADAEFSSSAFPQTTVTFENGGTYTLTCSVSSSTALDSPQVATLTVTVDSPVITVLPTDSTATELESSSIQDGGIFTLSRTGDTTHSLIVNVTISGSATPGSDFSVIPTTVTFDPGSATATVPVTVIHDTVIEGTETVVLTVGAGSGYQLGITPTATVSITENTNPVISIFPVSIGLTGNTLEFLLTRTGFVSNTSSVQWTTTGTTDNPAVAADFIGNALPSGTIAFAANETTKTLSILTNSATTNVAFLKTFKVSLNTPVNAVLSSSDSSALGVILTEPAESSTDNIRGQSTATVTCAANATVTGTFVLPISCVIISVTVNKACWFRLYSSTTAAAADAARLRTVPPGLATGVIADPVLPGAVTLNLEPAPVAMSREATPVASYPFRVTNDSTTGDITVTLTYLTLES